LCPEEAPPDQESRPPEAAGEGGAVELLEEVRRALGDAVLDAHVVRDDLWVRVRRESWRRTAEVCRQELGFDYFSFLSGIDWMPHTWPNPKVEEIVEEEGVSEAEAAATALGEDEAAVPAEPPSGVAGPDPDGAYETGYAGGETRFQVLARLHSLRRGRGITLKADLDDDRPRIETWSVVYPGADWHERETWEMYGFEFVGHPHLAHLYLPGAFEGFPLRKDFPLLAREVKPWPGLVDVEPFPPGTAT